MKQVPGRKTDVNDAQWLAQLVEAGLLRSSFVPPPEIRQLRNLTRYRTRLVQDRVRETQRVDKLLEGAGVKLGVVASKTLGVSGRAMLDALIAGERDPGVLAGLAGGRLRSRARDLCRALPGRFDDHHAAMARVLLRHIDQIDELIAPFAVQRDRLRTIPGIGDRAPQVIIAEIGADMTRFPSAGHLASWAGVCPGNNESAGKRRSGRTSHGDTWLQSVLVEAAHSTARTKDTYLAAQFWQIARRRGKKRAAVAVAHSILTSIWHMLTNNVDHHDLGGDFFTRRQDPDRRTRQLVDQLRRLGYDIKLEPAA